MYEKYSGRGYLEVTAAIYGAILKCGRLVNPAILPSVPWVNSESPRYLPIIMVCCTMSMLSTGVIASLLYFPLLLNYTGKACIIISPQSQQARLLYNAGTVVALEKEAGILKQEHQPIVEAFRDKVIKELNDYLAKAEKDV